VLKNSVTTLSELQLKKRFLMEEVTKNFEINYGSMPTLRERVGIK